MKGIDMKGRPQKLALFADDVLIYLSTPDTSVPELRSQFEEFGCTESTSSYIQL